MPPKGRYTKKTMSTRHKKRQYPKTDKMFTKKVKSILHRQLETKTYGVNIWNSTAITLPNPTVAASTQADIMNPNGFNGIALGTSDGQRIGSKIQVKSCYVTGFIQMLAGNLRPCYIRMVVAKSKINSTAPNVDSFNAGAFEFAVGSVAPANTLVDISRRMNPDNFTFYTQRIFKIGPSASVNTNNNDFSVSKFFKINLSKHIHTVDYSPVTQNPTAPNNFQIFFYGAYEDGTAITFGPYTGPLVSITADFTVKYTDA